MDDVTVGADVLTLAAAELRQQRAENARGYARAQALADLHDLALPVAARLGAATITFDQLGAAVDGDEAQRARLQHLLSAIPRETTPNEG